MLEIVSIVIDEHCLVAKLGLASKYFAFSFLINSSKFFKLVSIKFSFSSDLILDFLFKIFVQSSSNLTPFLPISLQAFKILSGILNGS